MKLVRSIISVSIANIVNFGTSFIIGFILPAILTVQAYGYYKEYILYLSFAYLLNFGFNDGIYIYYGGKELEGLSHKKVQQEHNFILLFQIIVFILTLAVGFIQGSQVILLFAVASFFMTIITYHQNLLQATGNFSSFSKGNILKSIFYVLILLLGIFVLRSDNYVFYTVLNILSLVFLFLYFEFQFRKRFGFASGLNIQDSKVYFKIGIFVLLANMSLTLVGNVGSWIIKFAFPIEMFAQYSFQSSILNVILLVVSAIGQVFYNLISKHKDDETLQSIKDLSLILGVIASLAFFVFALIIERFLPKYIPAIDLLSMTFLAIPYIMISKILIANLYKATRSERKYFIDSVLYVLFAFLIVGGAYLIWKNMLVIALATSVTYLLWYFYASRIEFKMLAGGTKEWILILSHIIVFCLAANYLDNIKGFIVFFGYSLLVLLLYRKELMAIKNRLLAK